jgi:hypothetical protein
VRIPFPFRRAAAGPLALTLFLLAHPVPAEIEPDTRVESFTLRKFSDQGVRLWDLSGEEALFLDDQIIRIIELELDLSSAGESNGTRLRSPEARIYVEDNSASGNGLLFVEGDGYTLRGEDWEWDGDRDTIEVRRGAHVRFDEAIDRILD